MSRLGFIGLGVMGLPMARNLLAGGHAVQAWNRSPGRYDALTDTTARTAGKLAELADCEVVFVNVSDDDAVERVLFGPSGLVEGLSPDADRPIVVDMGTTSPSYTRRCAERLRQLGVAMLDAPVSGGEAGAIAGSLSIMVGGAPEDFERVLPLFSLLGKNIVHVGANGAGQIAKACNQIVVSATLMGVAEAFHFARQQGLDPAKVREALLGGSAYSKILEIHGQRMLDGNYVPGFRARLHKKDLDIVAVEAAALGMDLSAIQTALSLLQSMLEDGRGELDSSAIYGAMNRPDS